MHPVVDLYFLNLFVSWFVRIFVLPGWISSPFASVLFFEVRDHYLSSFTQVAITITSSEKRRIEMQSHFS